MTKKGIWYALCAYTSWGLLPVYWKWLHSVSPVQLLCHRIAWSFLALIIIILFLRQAKTFRTAVLTPNVLRIYLLAAALVAVNWLLYVWAVNTNHMVETSLGYFINPLLSVLMGVIFLRERLRRLQWIPLMLAGAGVLYLTIIHGSLPWISLGLALSFGLYGLVKKIAPLGSLFGLALETCILLLPALFYLLYSEHVGQGAFLHGGTLLDILLIGTGPVTTIPLLWFASAARRIPLSLVGILQYITPTLQFLLGVFMYGEPFSSAQFVGYSIVWIALVIYAVEGLVAYRSRQSAAAPMEI